MRIKLYCILYTCLSATCFTQKCLIPYFYALSCKRGNPKRERTGYSFPSLCEGHYQSDWCGLWTSRVILDHMRSGQSVWTLASHTWWAKKAFFWNELCSNNKLEQKPKEIQYEYKCQYHNAPFRLWNKLFDIHSSFHMSFVKFWLMTSNEVTYLAAGNLYMNYDNSCSGCVVKLRSKTLVIYCPTWFTVSMELVVLHGRF